MSGPTYTLNLKKRITYAEFKALPEGLQKSYVQNIIDEDYGISTNAPTKKNNFGELLVLLLRSLQRGELCKANQGLRPRRTAPAGLRSSRGSRARALCY